MNSRLLKLPFINKQTIQTRKSEISNPGLSLFSRRSCVDVREHMEREMGYKLFCKQSLDMDSVA